MMQTIHSYLVPRRLEEALQAIASGDATVFCGGTDLAPQTEAGQRSYRGTLLNIRRIEGIQGIELGDRDVSIGALSTVTDIRRSELLATLAPVLVETADCFASDQIRNAASIGGNLCNASPAADMVMPLLVLDARVQLASWVDGAMSTRDVALDQFFTGPGKTVKADNELLTRVVFPRPAAGFFARFRKSGPRPALEISTVSLAVAGRIEEGAMHGARIALGAVAPTPIRARGAEALLEGRTLDAQAIAAAAAAVAADARPIDDVRASAWYRDHLLRVFTEEVLNDVAGN